METLEPNDWWSGLDLGKAIAERPTSFSNDQLIRLLAALNNAAWQPSSDLDPANEAVKFVGSLGERPASPRITTADIPEGLFENPEGSYGVKERSQKNPAGEKAKLGISNISFGGPQGPLPNLLVEELMRRERLGDKGTSAFLDVFIHRLVSLGYSIRRDFRTNLETRDPKESASSQFVRALLGAGGSKFSNIDEDLGDDTLLRYLPLLIKRPLSAEAIRRIVSDYLSTSVEIKQLVGRWLQLEETEHSHLGLQERNNRLGRGFVLGRTFWDQTSGLSLNIGPLSLKAFEDILPGNEGNRRLKQLLRFCVSSPTYIEATLVLDGNEQPLLELSSANPARLGWTSWLQSQTPSDRNVDIVLLESRECI